MAVRCGRWASGPSRLSSPSIGARGIQNDYLEHRYIGVTPTLDAALARAAGYEHPRIGLAGAWPVTTLSPVLALFGPDLANDVSYVGETRDGTLYPYEDVDSYADALKRGGYDLVMVGNEKPLAFPQRDEADWTRAAGYREVAADDELHAVARRPAELARETGSPGIAQPAATSASSSS